MRLNAGLTILVFALSMAVEAQNSIPAGTILPVTLSSPIKTSKVTPGQPIYARVMQDIPLDSGERIRAGSKLQGEVVSVAKPGASGSEVTLQFNRVLTKTGQTAVTTNLRAIASYGDIAMTQLPTTVMPDRGSSPESWTTVQVGGDVVYRGGGPVTGNGITVVGSPAPGGVLVKPIASRDCPLPSGGDRTQAMWVFSASACGVYGFEDLKIMKGAPGAIVLSSPTQELKISKGTGFLLETN